MLVKVSRRTRKKGAGRRFRGAGLRREKKMAFASREAFNGRFRHWPFCSRWPRPDKAASALNENYRPINLSRLVRLLFPPQRGAREMRALG